MESDTLEFIQILNLDYVELWDYTGQHHHLIAKGSIEVLYNNEMVVTLLKLHHFKYALDRTLKIVTSSEKDKQFRSYLLPHCGGCYLLKLGTSSSEASVTNLETIFENSCQLVRDSNIESQLQSYDEKGGILTRSGELIKDAFIKSSSLVSKGVDTVIHKAQGVNPNQTLVRKIEEIRMVDKEQSAFETFLRNDIIELLETSNEFSKRQDEGFWNHFGQETSDPSSSEQLKTTSAFGPSIEEKTRLQKLNEKGHALVDKAKESFAHLTSKITGKVEIKEEDKILLRSDNFTDIGEMPYLPIDDPGLLDKAKDVLSDIATAITAPAEELKEEVSQKEEEIQEKGDNTENESMPVVEQAKEEVKGLARKVSQTLEEHRDPGDLSSETTIQPNREEPSPLEKINKQYSQVANKVVGKVEDAVEAITEPNQGESVEPEVQEKGKSIFSSVKEGIHNITSKLCGHAEKNKLKLKKEGETETQEVKPEEGTEGFREVKTGFSETIEELRYEQEEDQIAKELHSNNPFEPLSTGGSDETNVTEGVNEAKSLTGKVKEGLVSVSNQISEKLTDTKEKIKSVFI